MFTKYKQLVFISLRLKKKLDKTTENSSLMTATDMLYWSDLIQKKMCRLFAQIFFGVAYFY